MRRSDLQGAARLVTDATAGLADLVEAMHERIARVPGLPAAPPDGRTRGLTGLVYKSIRGVTRVVGGSLEALLGLLGPSLSSDGALPGREALVAALNGVLGDYLAATGNPLATPMALRHDGQALPGDAAGLAAALPHAGSEVLLLVHGLCMNDRQWTRDGHDHGRALARHFGFTPLYLLYNSGLHVSINGHALALQLEALVDGWPRPLTRIALLGHSMGGLLLRSALHIARHAGHRWPARVSDMVFLGTPHHGAPLERAGHWIDLLLDATPYSKPLSRLGKVRSAGITDLRYGNLLDEDWVGRDRFSHRRDHRQPVPLPEHVRCAAIAACLAPAARGTAPGWLGDGLVPVDSALGRHRDPRRVLAFADDRQWIGEGIGHLGLLSDPAVYERLQDWLAPAPSR